MQIRHVKSKSFSRHLSKLLVSLNNYLFIAAVNFVVEYSYPPKILINKDGEY